MPATPRRPALTSGAADAISSVPARSWSQCHAIHLDHFTGELEVHAVAVIIAVEPRRPAPAIGRVDRLRA
jgi:hypothetical protein